MCEASSGLEMKRTGDSTSNRGILLVQDWTSFRHKYAMRRAVERQHACERLDVYLAYFSHCQEMPPS